LPIGSILAWRRGPAQRYHAGDRSLRRWGVVDNIMTNLWVLATIVGPALLYLTKLFYMS
jgi:hypothetical protein